MNPDNSRPGQAQPVRPASQEMGFDKYVAIALIVGLIAGFVIGHSVGASKSEKGDNASSTDSLIYGDGDADDNGDADQDSAMETAEGTEIEVGDQKAGHDVVISKLVLDKPYWVAIRDSHADVKFPYILGAKKVAAGTYSDLSVYANRATVSGTRYDVVFYKDSPSFNYDASMLIMSGEHPAGATFQAN